MFSLVEDNGVYQVYVYDGNHVDFKHLNPMEIFEYNREHADQKVYFVHHFMWPLRGNYYVNKSGPPTILFHNWMGWSHKVEFEDVVYGVAGL